MRRWREGHRRELNARRRDAADVRSAEARLRNSARAKLAMALRRGKQHREPCRFCGAEKVEAVMLDPREWKNVGWACREHRQAECERRRAATAQRTYEAKQAVWYDERARVLAAVDLLPPEEQTQLRTIAARGLAGMRLTPEAPLYVMNLVRVYKAMYEH